MTYDPKIYIRDYGDPAGSILVYSRTISVNLNPADVVRNLVVDVVTPFGPTDGILLSGDAQVSGTDVLLLSGIEGKVLLSDQFILRVKLHDVEFLTGTFIDSDAALLAVETYPAAFERNLLVRGDLLIADITLHPSDVVRSLVVNATGAEIDVTLHDVEIIVVRHILLSGDAQVSGTDRLLLSGDAQVSGTDSIIISE